MDTTSKFFIYARKSTDDADRQLRSIEDQLAETRELAAKHNLDVVDVLLEKQSAKKPGRPIFNQMLERIEKGEASGIIAWHPDRLARNMLDGGRIIHMVDTGAIKEMKFKIVEFEPTSQGKLTLAMFFGMSKYYVDNLAENIRRGQRNKLKNGIWPSLAPVGYLNDRKGRVIVPDPERGPMIRKAFELYATGDYTLDKLTELLTGLGLTNSTTKKFQGQPLSRAQVHRLLRNPIYYGTISYSGEHHEGKHEPLISKSLFDACQTILERKSQPKILDRFKPYLYRGFFRCGECGCLMTTETQKGHNYLRCTKRVKKNCSQPYVREEVVTEQVATALTSFTIPDDWANWMIGELQLDRERDAADAASSEGAIKEEIRLVETKLDRLMTGYLDQLFGPEEYKLSKNRILAEKHDLMQRRAAFVTSRESRFEPAIRFINRVKQAKIVALGGDAAAQRDFLKSVGSNLNVFDREVRFEARGAWKVVGRQRVLGAYEKAPVAKTGARSAENRQNELKRRGGDSNPRAGLSPLQHFQCCSFSHSDTSPEFLLTSNRASILAGSRAGFHCVDRAGART